MQAYLKFRGATYVLAEPASPAQLGAFVTASLRKYANEAPLQRVMRLVKVAKYVQALQAQPPEVPQARAMDAIKTEVFAGLKDFFKNLQKSTAVVDQLTLGNLAKGPSALEGLSGFLDKSTALQSLQVAKKALAQAAQVFPELGKAGLDAKIDELAKFWGDWDKFLRGGDWIKGVMEGLKQMEQGRQTLKKKIFEVQGPIVQLVDKMAASGAK